tara:strand:+ start:189 stop:461 length:273 start_codon:yes stop_codon:yes gene_type:complete
MRKDKADSLLEFPCLFPIKAMGLAEIDFENVVTEIIRKHVPLVEIGAVRSRTSSKGKYLAVTVEFQATSKAQLDSLYTELSSNKKILLVL